MDAPRCAFCDAPVRLYPTTAVLRACSLRACQTQLAAWRTLNDPEWAARQREAKARRRAALIKRREWAVCPGCGRSFPSHTLEQGTCGGEWCPSGQEAAG